MISRTSVAIVQSGEEPAKSRADIYDFRVEREEKPGTLTCCSDTELVIFEPS